MNRYWRVVATGMAFSVFGMGAIWLGLFWSPVLALTHKGAARKRRIRRAIHRGCRFFVWLMHSLGLLTYEVRGAEHLVGERRLIVANHPSLIDAVFLLALMPRVVCIAKLSMWRNPFLRWPVRWAGYIPNFDSERLLHACDVSLRSGESLMVFPEGTRTRPGMPVQFRRGAAQVAILAGAEIVPVRIDCYPPTLFKGQPWYRVPDVKPNWRIDIGEPFTADSVIPAELDRPLAARRLTRVFASRLSQQ